MPAFHDVQFPTRISYGARGGPTFNTTVRQLRSGQESRNANWSATRRRYDVTTAIQDEADKDEFLSFFINRKGKAHGFRFKDWADYSIVAGQIGVGDNVETQFQIIKTYNDGSYQTVRNITRPIGSTLKVYFDAVEQVSGFSLNDSTGIITFTTPPASPVVITVDCEFDTPCRFDIDELSQVIEAFDQYVGDGLAIVELRE